MNRIKVNGHGAVYLDDVVIGWVNNKGCENENCLKAIQKGDLWHATPSGPGDILPMYHYYWLESAIAVLRARWNDWTGDHKSSCLAVRSRRDLFRDMVRDPHNPYLEGAWFEYFAGGDQESELCDCGLFEQS